MTPPMSNTPARKAQEERAAIIDMLDSRNGHPATIHTPVECLVSRGEVASGDQSETVMFGDDGEPCPTCGGTETHVSFEDIEANYCRTCRAYFRPTPAPLPVAENTGRPEGCICNYGPDTDGPDECCPHHGRPYEYWVQECFVLGQRLDAAISHADTPVPAPSDTGPSDEAAVAKALDLAQRLRRIGLPVPRHVRAVLDTPTSRPSTDGDAEGLAATLREVAPWISWGSAEKVASSLLTSDWLAALVPDAEARVGERIALAIEAYADRRDGTCDWHSLADSMPKGFINGLDSAARIARATGSGEVR